jgi:phage gp36-like protein
MSYSTLVTIKKKIDERTLIQLLNDEVRAEEDIDLNDTADLVVVRFQDAADAAQAEVDPYLIGRYTLPFASTPRRVIDISDDITKFNIYKRRGEVPEDVRKDKEAAVKSLIEISKGNADLGIAAEPQNLSNEITTNKTASDKVFNTDMWNKF